MKTVVKALKVSVALNAEIRIRAMRLGVSAHSIMVETLEREFLSGVPKEVIPKQEQPKAESLDKNPVKDAPKPERKLEPTTKDKAAEWTLVSEYIYTDGNQFLLKYFGEKEYFSTETEAKNRLKEFKS